MFAITNATEFFAKVKQDLASLEEKIDDSGRAMNCILSAYHLHEWVWAYVLKPSTPRKLGNLMIKDKSSLRRLARNCLSAFHIAGKNLRTVRSIVLLCIRHRRSRDTGWAHTELGRGVPLTY